MDVLLTIDLQEASIGKYSQWDMRAVVERINQLGIAVRANGGKVVHVLHDGMAEEGLAPNSPGWQPVGALTVLAQDLFVRKTLNDAFHESDLEAKLIELGAERLLITGWATDFCVDGTVRSAVSKGHQVCVVSDCHTLDHRPHLCACKVITHHNWVWSGLLSTASIQVTPSQQIIESFKAVL